MNTSVIRIVGHTWLRKYKRCQRTFLQDNNEDKSSAPLPPSLKSTERTPMCPLSTSRQTVILNTTSNTVIQPSTYTASSSLKTLLPPPFLPPSPLTLKPLMDVNTTQYPDTSFVRCPPFSHGKPDLPSRKEEIRAYVGRQIPVGTGLRARSRRREVEESEREVPRTTSLGRTLRRTPV